MADSLFRGGTGYTGPLPEGYQYGYQRRGADAPDPSGDNESDTYIYDPMGQLTTLAATHPPAGSKTEGGQTFSNYTEANKTGEAAANKGSGIIFGKGPNAVNAPVSGALAVIGGGIGGVFDPYAVGGAGGLESFANPGFNPWDPSTYYGAGTPGINTGMTDQVLNNFGQWQGAGTAAGPLTLPGQTIDLANSARMIPTPDGAQNFAPGAESVPGINPPIEGEFSRLFTPQDAGSFQFNTGSAPSSVDPTGGGSAATPAGTPIGTTGAPGIPETVEEAAKRRLVQQATTATTTAPASPSIFQRGIDSITKNPLAAGGLALNLFSQANSKNKGKDLASQMKAVSAPAQAASQDLINRGLAGTPSAASAHEIDQWLNASTAAINQRYVNMGRDPKNDSAAAKEIADVKAKAIAMKDKAAMDLLSMGLNAAGIAQGPQLQAALAAAQQDKDLAASMGNMLQSMAMLEALSARGAPVPRT